MDFSQEDINYLKNSLKDSFNEHGGLLKMSKDPIWLTAFALYNTNNEKRLSVTCGSCYMKVFLFILGYKSDGAGSE